MLIADIEFSEYSISEYVNLYRSGGNNIFLSPGIYIISDGINLLYCGQSQTVGYRLSYHIRELEINNNFASRGRCYLPDNKPAPTLYNKETWKILVHILPLSNLEDREKIEIQVHKNIDTFVSKGGNGQFEAFNSAGASYGKLPWGMKQTEMSIKTWSLMPVLHEIYKRFPSYGRCKLNDQYNIEYPNNKIVYYLGDMLDYFRHEDQYIELLYYHNKTNWDLLKSNVKQGIHTIAFRSDIDKEEQEEIIINGNTDNVLFDSLLELAPKGYIIGEDFTIHYDNISIRLYSFNTLINKSNNYLNNIFHEYEKDNKQIIQILEDEWINNKNLCINRISHILNLNTSNKIAARKCIIGLEQNSEIANFLKEYHIQGAPSNNKAITLRYDNELVSVMTYIPIRYGIEEGLEIQRFATKYAVVGAFQKSLKYLVSQLNPKTLVSYADSRWSTGKVYKLAGFSLQNHNIGYWYTKGTDRRHRSIFMRHKLESKFNQSYDKSLTEEKICNAQGWYRVYDAGQQVYKLDVTELIAA